MKTKLVLSLLCSVAVVSCDSSADVETYKYAKVTPVAYDDVEISGGFLGDVRDRSRDIGIPTFYDELEEHDYIENFKICSEQRREPHVRRMNCNEFVYKQMGAMSWYSQESAVSKELLAEVRDIVLAAQQPDGYLNTYYENVLLKEQGESRFAPSNRCEFLNFGHFTQAAIADYQANGDRELLDAAIKFADLIVDLFADPNDLPYTPYQGPVNKKYEHPNHELAMVELYRVTGDKRYLDFAAQTIEEYGYFGDEYFNEIWGHAVMENLLEAGAVDVYLESGDARIMDVATRLWNDAVERKMYITGGTGCTAGSESYGAAYQLPNATTYSETCAAIALFFWHHKMLLATGDTKYADQMDRALYNNIMAGYGLDGKTYFYMNPLEWTPEAHKRPGRRFEWHHCPCCPPFIHRLMGALDQYIYTYDESGIQVNMYADSHLNHKLASGESVTLTQKGNYPHSGEIEFMVDAPKSAKGAIKFRIPGWCDAPTFTIDGESVEFEMEGGYAVLDQPWAVGRVILLEMPMEPVVIAGNPKVADQVGKIAIERGPLVYCVEQADNSDVDLAKVVLDGECAIQSNYEPSLLGGVVTLDVSTSNDARVKMIPYYSWANRDSGAMYVWLKSRNNN